MSPALLMRTIGLFLVLLAGLTTPSVAQEADAVVAKLGAEMTGSFSSADQARGDINFQNTTLNVVRIASDRTDGYWLYAEQALMGALRHPHKQTVYQLSPRADGSIECRLYDLKDPVPFTNAWQKDAIKANLTPDELVLREGCTVILKTQPNGSFRGITEGKGCLNTLRGATYATTELIISEKEIVIWERGYNANDRQVWGSLHGGYVFKRVE